MSNFVFLYEVLSLQSIVTGVAYLVKFLLSHIHIFLKSFRKEVSSLFPDCHGPRVEGTTCLS